jgi:hypothetical protein
VLAVEVTVWVSRRQQEEDEDRDRRLQRDD